MSASAHKRRCVIMTGSRNAERVAAFQAINDALHPLHLCEGDVVLHGGARGIDQRTEDYVRGCWPAVAVISCPAQWRVGRQAGPQRNRAMAQIASQLEQWCGYEVIVLAFPAPDSRGTRDMIAVAKRYGWEPIVHNLEDSR